jgi:hypothetical protein
MQFATTVFTLISMFFSVKANEETCVNDERGYNCISFSVGPGTGCAWMCNYCATQLGTNNYYFQDGVCTYQTGGCVGSPQSGKQYTCCSI